MVSERFGRFVLFILSPGVIEYVTSWDTWADAQAAFPIEEGFALRDDKTGREWRNGDRKRPLSFPRASLRP